MRNSHGRTAPPVTVLREVTALNKGQRVRGDMRTRLAAHLGKEYVAGASIRSLMDETGRSFGFIHRILTEDAGLVLRGRGGNTRGTKEQSD